MKAICTFFVFLMTTVFYGQRDDYVTVKRSLRLMGSPIEITVVSLNEELGSIYIQEAIAEIKRIEKLISSWDPQSETSKINANAGVKPVAISRELFGLMERSIEISELTNGAFDISFSPLEDLWKFDGTMKRLPLMENIDQVMLKVGYGNIILDSKGQTVYLKKKGMRISFGGIGKGYAADKAKALLVSKEVKAGIINIGGDVTTWGTKASGENWVIGIINPERKDGLFSWLPILESSVATSGGKTDFMMINGKKYNHILDPRKGYLSTGVNSVSVLATSAEFSDALSTAILVLGKDAGLALINQLPDTEVLLVDDMNKMHKSSGVNLK